MQPKRAKKTDTAEASVPSAEQQQLASLVEVVADLQQQVARLTYEVLGEGSYSGASDSASGSQEPRRPRQSSMPVEPVPRSQWSRTDLIKVHLQNIDDVLTGKIVYGRHLIKEATRFFEYTVTSGTVGVPYRMFLFRGMTMTEERRELVALAASMVGLERVLVYVAANVTDRPAQGLVPALVQARVPHFVIRFNSVPYNRGLADDNLTSMSITPAMPDGTMYKARYGKAALHALYEAAYNTVINQ